MTTSPGSSDSKLSVQLITPTLTISTAAAPPEPPHEAISLSMEANPLMAKMEPSEIPMQTASARIPEATVSGMNHLPPAVGSPFISCHPPNQGGGVKEAVHPVVLWSSDVGGIKVLSSPLQLSPPASSVQLSLPNTLTEQQICPPIKETPSTDIPKTAPSLMASSNSEVNLIQQFVSDNISSPLPAQSGQSVEKFLSRIEQKPPNSSLKVEDNQPHVSDVPSGNPSLPSNIVMQFASILQSQKIVVDQQVPSNPSEIPTSVSGHGLVMDSLRHSISPTAVKSESSPSPVISNQPESSSLLATNPSSITFVKPIQEQTMSTVGNDRCSHGMSSALPIASTKISSKEPISVCEMSLLQGISDGPEVRSNQIPQSLGCMVNIQNSQLPLEASMQAPCSLTSKPITASLSDGASLTSTSDQPLPPQVNLEHDSLIPIVATENILHGIDSSSPPKDQMKKLSCDSMPSSDAIPLSVSSSVGLVEHLESTMRTNIQIGVDNLEGRSNENQNLRISQSVVPLERSGSCQVLLHHVEKERAADPLAEIHPVVYPSVRLPVHPLARKDIEDEQRSQSRVAMQGALKEGVAVEKLLQTEEEGPSNPSTQLHLAVTVGPRKGEDGGMVPQELTQMSDHDLLRVLFA
ncbi:hypothetical protein J437_LFUL010461 [Ladona fulva]|uniref:Uncharacterized protein n=1 Tax=Ladona fulva TaxID=123851 RepID=A0A8K0KJR1_LADFU|nr:hypothetical protein J437_LFUL010461 [Ladona fulva]